MEEKVEAEAAASNSNASNRVEHTPFITGSLEGHGADSFAATGLTAQRIFPSVLHEPETQVHAELRNNDNKILSLLNQNTGSYYSFRGLMRKLKLHQQSLARALDRLEERGLINRSQNGYRLNLDERKLDQLKGQTLLRKSNQPSFSLLLQTYIPKGLTARNIMEALGGRWFGRLRWIGLTESDIGYFMHWTNEENSFQVNLKLMWDSAVIETNAVSNSDKAEAMIGSFKMFEQITKLLQVTLRN